MTGVLTTASSTEFLCTQCAAMKLMNPSAEGHALLLSSRRNSSRQSWYPTRLSRIFFFHNSLYDSIIQSDLSIEFRFIILSHSCDSPYICTRPSTVRPREIPPDLYTLFRRALRAFSRYLCFRLYAEVYSYFTPIL